MSDEGLGSQEEPMHSRDVERGPSLGVLYVWVRTSLHQELHAQGCVVAQRRVVQWGLPLAVEGVHIHLRTLYTETMHGQWIIYCYYK